MVGLVLFHVFPRFVVGGFIGVDVFYVISGFVISHVYLASLNDGSVKVGAFFLRRIRRLVPACFALVVVVTLLAYLLLNPNDLLN